MLTNNQINEHTKLLSLLFLIITFPFAKVKCLISEEMKAVGLSLNSFVPFFTPPPVFNNKSCSFDILILTSDLKSEINFSI